MSVISASEFRQRATRVIEIDGFEPEEKIEVRIKPASILALYVGGKLPNTLLATVEELFQVKDEEQAGKTILQDKEMMKASFEILDLVCKQCLVEPTYDEIGDLLTDNQKGQIMAAAQGNVKAAIPNIPKQENPQCD